MIAVRPSMMHPKWPFSDELGGQAAASTIGKLVDGVSISSSFDGLGGSVSTASMKGWGKRPI